MREKRKKEWGSVFISPLVTLKKKKNLPHRPAVSWTIPSLQLYILSTLCSLKSLRTKEDKQDRSNAFTYLTVQNKYLPQGELAVHKGPGPGKVHPHAPSSASATEHSLHCSPLSEAHPSLGREKQAPLKRGCGGRPAAPWGLRGPRAKPSLHWKKRCKWHRRGPAERGKGTAMLCPVPAPQGFRSATRPAVCSLKQA